VKPDRGDDIIVPWELSRLQFVPTLIQSHRLGRDERTRRLFEATVDDWIARNPYRFGVNWMTGMDVALRAISLSLGLSYFGHLRTERYRKVLWAHAEYLLEEDLKHPPVMRNNHYMISVVGSIMLGALFAGPQAEELFETAVGRLDSEILRQFHEDGGDFESAVHYHELTLEAVLVALCFLKAVEDAGRLGPARTGWISSEAQKAITLVVDYTNAFGGSPQFGDSSDSRVLVHRDYFDCSPLDHSFIADMAEAALPKKGRERLPGGSLYPRSGYGFISGARYGLCCNATTVVEDDHGGHGHCDKTSFVLRVDETPVFVDAGTYCYTPDVGRRFEHRRTRSHNLVVIDGREQAPLDPLDVFQTPLGIAPSIRRDAERAPDTWVMEHRGYSRLPGLGAVSRIIRCLDGRIEVEERIEGTGEHLIEIMYHLHPDLRCRRDGGALLVAKGERRLCTLEIPEGFTLIETTGLYSPAYREDRVAVTLVLSRRTVLPASASYAIVIG
jgi:hypothetical protein